MAFEEDFEEGLRLIERQFEQKISDPERILLALGEDYLNPGLSAYVRTPPHQFVVKPIVDFLRNAIKPQKKADAKSEKGGDAAAPADAVMVAIHKINQNMQGKTLERNSSLAAKLSAFLFYDPRYAQYFTPNILNNLRRDSGLEALMRVVNSRKLFDVERGHYRQLQSFAPWISSTVRNEWLTSDWNMIKDPSFKDPREPYVFSVKHLQHFGALLASADEKWQMQTLDHMEKNQEKREKWLKSSEELMISICHIFQRKPDLIARYKKITEKIQSHISSSYSHHVLSAYIQTFPAEKNAIHQRITKIVLYYFKMHPYQNRAVLSCIQGLNIPLTEEMKKALNDGPKRLDTIAEHFPNEPNVGNFPQEEEQKIFETHLEKYAIGSEWEFDAPFFCFFL